MGSADGFSEIARRLGPLARPDISLAPLCTYRVGGKAALFIEVDSVASLETVAAALSGHDDVPVLVLGRGSNLLVADAGFSGLVVQLGDEFTEIAIDETNGFVRVGASALLPVAARKTAAASLTGFEWAVGVPGSVGGAVRMNAGGHGSDMHASVQRVGVFDLRTGAITVWTPEELGFQYRSSAISAEHLVLYADLQLQAGDRATSQEEISEIVRWRRANQPGGQNAGSVFTNPPGDSAGRLIDSAGLKGFRRGSAEVSTKHANFIQADAGGSADDVHRVIEAVKRRVIEVHGVDLHCENLLIGFEPAPPKTTPAPSADEGDADGTVGTDS